MGKSKNQKNNNGDTVEASPFPTEVVSLDVLKQHPRNYRGHPEDQLKHIIASIKQHGFYRNVVVARDLTILAGHGVYLAAKQMGLKEIPIIKLNIAPDDPAALKVLTGDNEIGHLVDLDDRMLTEILRDIMREDSEGLLGTGYDDMMLANLVMVTRHQNEIADFDAASEWLQAGMPGYDPGNDSIRCTIEFHTEDDLASFLDKLELTKDQVSKRGKMRSFWWPPRERNDLDSLLVESEAECDADDA